MTVAILGLSDFDPNTIDRSSIRLASAPAVSVAPSTVDVNGDGIADLTADFAMSALEVGKVKVGDFVPLKIVGLLKSSRVFRGVGRARVVADTVRSTCRD